MEGRVVMHVDMDAFYAAVEARDDPALRGIPLVVGADPKGGRGRGVVCTASYEARSYGIRSAMPISQAYRAAPHARFIRPDFGKYVAESRKVMAILARYADVIEVAGLDEAYLDVSERVRGTDGPDWDLAASLARSLQAAVKRECGLGCSVGVAPSKSVAKVASDMRKPHGLVRVAPHEVQAFLAPLPTGKLHGCGPKTAALLRASGIHTVEDLARTPARDLRTRYGAHGTWLHDVANGNDSRPVDGDRGDRKSRGSESTFQHDVREPAALGRALRDLADDVLEEHRRQDSRPFSTLTVKVRYANFATVSRSRTTPQPILAKDPAAAAWVQATVAALAAPCLDGRPVRLLGVRLSGFQEPRGQKALDAYGMALRPFHPSAAGPQPIVRFRSATPGLSWRTLANY